MDREKRLRGLLWVTFYICYDHLLSFKIDMSELTTALLIKDYVHNYRWRNIFKKLLILLSILEESLFF